MAVGKLKELGVFGDDYDTPDGTGVRDYIHVVDLALGHVKALKKIDEKCGLAIYNLGTGHGYSVLDIVKNFEAATGVKIPYSIKPRRAGDIATCYLSLIHISIKEMICYDDAGISRFLICSRHLCSCILSTCASL